MGSAISQTIPTKGATDEPQKENFKSSPTPNVQQMAGASSSARDTERSLQDTTSSPASRKSEHPSTPALPGQDSLPSATEDMPPIVLSTTGMASNHPGLLKLVKAHLDEYTAEMDRGVNPTASKTVAMIIQGLVENFSPVILAADEESITRPGQTPRPLPLAHENVLQEGSHFEMMADKVHQCYLLMKEEFPIATAVVSQTPDSQTSNLDDDLLHDMEAPVGTRKRSKRQRRVPAPSISSRPRRNFKAGNGKHNPYAKLYSESLDDDSSMEAATPKRKARARVTEMDDTPVAANRGKKSRKGKLSIPLNLPSPGKPHVPVVRPEDLCYDWTFLQLNGTEAWNKLLQEHVNPAVTSTVPQVSTMDTYQLVQNLREGLRAIPPPENSILHEALENETEALKKCSDHLQPAFRETVRLYRGMLKFDRNEDHSRRASYHHKTPTQLRAYMKEIDSHAEKLKQQSSAVDPRPSRLSAIRAQLKQMRTKNDKSSEQSSQTVFWQSDFQALLDQEGPARKFLMIQDRH